MPSFRPLTWVIIVIQILFLIWIFGALSTASGNCDNELTQTSKDACEAGTAIGAGIGFMFIVFLWAMVDVILGVTWVVTNKNKRSCPACGHNVRKGIVVCPSCNFDFAAAARGQSLSNPSTAQYPPPSPNPMPGQYPPNPPYPPPVEYP